MELRFEVALVDIDEEMVDEVGDGHHDEAPHGVIKGLSLERRGPVRSAGNHENDGKAAQNGLPRKDELWMRCPEEVHGDEREGQRAAQDDRELDPSRPRVLGAVPENVVFVAALIFESAAFFEIGHLFIVGFVSLILVVLGVDPADLEGEREETQLPAAPDEHEEEGQHSVEYGPHHRARGPRVHQGVEVHAVHLRRLEVIMADQVRDAERAQNRYVVLVRDVLLLRVVVVSAVGGHQFVRRRDQRQYRLSGGDHHEDAPSLHDMLEDVLWESQHLVVRSEDDSEGVARDPQHRERVHFQREGVHEIRSELSPKYGDIEEQHQQNEHDMVQRLIQRTFGDIGVQSKLRLNV